MNIFGSLKNLIYEQEVVKVETTAKPEERKPGEVAISTPRFTGTGQPAAQPTYVFPQAVGEMLVQPDPGVLAFLAEEIKKKNLDGYDYFEFKDALVKLAAAIPDENLRLQAAFASVSSIVTAAKLIETANYYINHLQFLEKDFIDVTTKEYESTTGMKKKEFDGIDNQIALQGQKIEELNNDIAALRKKKIQLQGEIATEDAEFNIKQKKFTTSTTTVVNGIKHDITKLETLNGNK